MVWYIILFLLGFALLIKGGDWFVDGSCGVAKRFHIPELIIGATIVSIGTTLPETLVSSLAAVQGHGEMAYGNAIGSIICNTALIAAITITFKPSNVDKKSFLLPVIFFVIAVAIYLISAYILGSFPRIIGIILVLMFITYIVLQVILIKKRPKTKEIETVNKDEIIETQEEQEEKEINLEDEKKKNKKELIKNIVFLIVGAACIAGGAQLLVTYGSKIATEIGISEAVISITMVAIGTSLPELVTAITSLIKGHSSLSLGNIIGANLFNIILVSGLSVTLNPFALPVEKTISGINASLIIDIPIMLLVMGLLCLPSIIKGKTYRFQGILLLLIYAVFMILQFVL